MIPWNLALDLERTRGSRQHARKQAIGQLNKMNLMLPAEWRAA